MKKLALVMSLLLTTFMYGCDRNAEKFLTTQKFDAEVSFEVEVKSGYNLVEGTNSSAIRWNNYEANPDKGGKPQLFVKYEISEPTENTEQNESFTNRYRDGLFANELDENLISAKFENPDQIYRVNLGDELKIITTFKKSKKYNFDYKSTADVVIKEDGDNIQVISKMTVKENENRNKPYADRNFKTVEEFTEYQLGFLSEFDNKTTDFKAEELKLSKEYPLC